MISNECQHHWVLEASTRPPVQGVCRLCGAEEAFTGGMPLGDSGFHVWQSAGLARIRAEKIAEISTHAGLYQGNLGELRW